MTNQEAFDTALAAMRAQGQPSMKTVTHEDGYENTYCAYRGENGTRCAIGALIPDRLYNPAWDETEQNVVMLRGRLPLDLDTDFMQALQKALHDGPATGRGPFLAELERSAKEFSVRWNLTYKEPA